jgi:hypothetical protein
VERSGVGMNDSAEGSCLDSESGMVIYSCKISYNLPCYTTELHVYCSCERTTHVEG